MIDGSPKTDIGLQICKS